MESYGVYMINAAKMISAWTYGATLFPKNVPVISNLVDVFRVGAVEDVFVERDEVNTSASRLLSALQPGQIKKLVAGTGSGKSTTVPVSLAFSTSGVGIVITPTRQLAKSLHNYVSRSVAIGRYSKCATVLAHDLDDIKRVSGPAVCYFGASDFLMMMAQDKNVFNEFPVSYVYVDESHERIPEYVVIRYLVSAGVFSNVKLFLGSATSSDQDLENRTGAISFKTYAVKPDLMMYDDVDNLNSKSPLYHGRIGDRTLIYLPSSESFEVLKTYYEQNALPVFQLYEYASSADLIHLKNFLVIDKRPAVVLLTSIHQTGFTFNADTVVDCGVTLEMNVDCARKIVSVVPRPAFNYERIQRCGRVGRMASGVAYYVDHDAPDPRFEVYPGSECYVALWCKLFSLNLKHPLMRQWQQFVEPMSAYKICLLLCSTIHPLLLSAFIDDEGDVAKGTRTTFLNFLRRQRKLVSTSSIIVPDLVTKTWQEQILVLPCINVEHYSYKSEYLLPEVWKPWAHTMYWLLHGTDYVGNVKMDGSVYSSASTAISEMSDSGEGSVVFSSASERSVSRYGAAKKRTASRTGSGLRNSYIPNATLPSYSSQSVALEHGTGVVSSKIGKSGLFDGDTRGVVLRDGDSESFARGETALKYEAVIRAGDQVSGLRGHMEQLELQATVDKSVDKIHKWKAEVGSSAVLCDDDSVDDPVGFTLQKRVYAIVGDNRLLAPRHGYLMSKFYRMETTVEYYDYYRKLKHGEVVISQLSKMEKETYFLAIIVTWNHAISGLLQLRAAPANVITRRLVSSKVDKHNSTLGRVKLLFDVFNVYTLHLSHRVIDQSGGHIDLTGYSQDVDSAEYVKLLASDNFRCMWNKKNRIATSIYVGDERVGSALKDRFSIVTALHVYKGTVSRPREFKDLKVNVLFEDAGADLVHVHYGDAVFKSFDIELREPVVGENVVLFCPVVNKVVPLGLYNIVTVSGRCVYTGSVPDGASGAPLVATSDGAVVGIHKGIFPCYDGDVMSEFVPYKGNIKCGVAHV